MQKRWSILKQKKPQVALWLFVVRTGSGQNAQRTLADTVWFR